MPKKTVLALALCGYAAFAGAETVYVTDILRLGLHRASDTSDRPIENLVSGTELTVLERTASFLRVRTADGQEGWVKSAFIVAQKPAQARVAELTTELSAVRLELDDVRNARLTAEQEATQFGKQIAVITGPTDSIQDTLMRLQRDNESYEARLDSYRRSLPLPWVGAALVVSLVVGFVAGWWWLDASIRRRHGGFRVY